MTAPPQALSPADPPLRTGRGRYIGRRPVAAPTRARGDDFVLRLWLPLSPLFLLLSPIPILAIPLLYLARPVRGMNYAAAVFSIGRVLLAMRGVDIDIQSPGAVVRLKIL